MLQKGENILITMNVQFAYPVYISSYHLLLDVLLLLRCICTQIDPAAAAFHWGATNSYRTENDAEIGLN